MSPVILSKLVSGELATLCLRIAIGRRGKRASNVAWIDQIEKLHERTR